MKRFLKSFEKITKFPNFYFKVTQIRGKTWFTVKTDFWPKSSISGNDATVDKLYL